MFNTDADTHKKKWLVKCLTGKHGYTFDYDILSTTERYTNGVPEVSVLSQHSSAIYAQHPLQIQLDTHILSDTLIHRPRTHIYMNAYSY